MDSSGDAATPVGKSGSSRVLLRRLRLAVSGGDPEDGFGDAEQLGGVHVDGELVDDAEYWNGGLGKRSRVLAVTTAVPDGFVPSAEERCQRSQHSHGIVMGGCPDHVRDRAHYVDLRAAVGWPELQV